MAISGGFGVLLDLVTGRPRRWYMRGDGIKRWISNDMPCDAGKETDLWRCTVCGRVGTVGRCRGEATREPFRPNTLITQPREVVPCNGAEKTPTPPT